MTQRIGTKEETTTNENGVQMKKNRGGREGGGTREIDNVYMELE